MFLLTLVSVFKADINTLVYTGLGVWDLIDSTLYIDTIEVQTHFLVLIFIFFYPVCFNLNCFFFM